MQDREKITKKTLPFDFILFKISLYFQGNTWPSKDRPVFTEQNPMLDEAIYNEWKLLSQFGATEME